MRRIFLSSKDFQITAAPDPFGGGGGMPAPGNSGGTNNSFTNTSEPGPSLHNFECPECGQSFNEGRDFKEHMREDHRVRDSVR